MRMNPGTINTILNTAPMIIQAASKLIKLIRERESSAKPSADSDEPTNLRQEITRIDNRLNENSRSDMEQIRLIEELARQNESLAETLRDTLQRLRLVNYIASLSLAGAVCAIGLSLTGS